MSLHRDILHVLRHGGLLARSSATRIVPGRHGTPSFGPGLQIGANYRNGKIAADRAAGTITFTMSPTEADINDPAKCVEVSYEGDAVMTGAIYPPGCLFTDSLSGCIALVFRDPFGNIHMAHQYRDTRYRYDPVSAFTDRGCTLLWKYESLGISDVHPGCFGVALACAEGPHLYCFAFAGKGTPEGLRCAALLHYDHVYNWASADTWSGQHEPL